VFTDVRGNPKWGKILVVGGIAAVISIFLTVGMSAGCKEYNRYQKRADADNAVKITHILIQKANQQAKINRAQIQATIAEAQKRREEAKGIRDAQDTIQATLTDRYLQHEAIQAQKAIATSGSNNSIIYVPSGSNGTPLVQDISAGTTKGFTQGK
jgi:regulator of protease activity HflC (stomatin/prohibitin superfamily)